MWCPGCGDKFLDQFTSCRACGLALVPQRPTVLKGAPAGESAVGASNPGAEGPHTLAPASAARLFCTQRGAASSEHARFCGSCGLPIADSARPVAAAPAWLPTQGQYATARPARKQSTNGFAVASMVLGIIWIYWIGTILALVFGYQARKQIAQSEGTEGGGGMATAGIVLGWIGVATLVAILTIGFLAALGGSGST